MKQSLFRIFRTPGSETLLELFIRKHPISHVSLDMQPVFGPRKRNILGYRNPNLRNRTGIGRKSHTTGAQLIIFHFVATLLTADTYFHPPITQIHISLLDEEFRSEATCTHHFQPKGIRELFILLQIPKDTCIQISIVFSNRRKPVLICHEPKRRVVPTTYGCTGFNLIV